ncbi:MAG: hypothetical protein ABJC04_07460 [Verrucomicrobiota bacterium]
MSGNETTSGDDAGEAMTDGAAGVSDENEAVTVFLEKVVSKAIGARDPASGIEVAKTSLFLENNFLNEANMILVFYRFDLLQSQMEFPSADRRSHFPSQVLPEIN